MAINIRGNLIQLKFNLVSFFNFKEAKNQFKHQKKLQKSEQNEKIKLCFGWQKFIGCNSAEGKDEIQTAIHIQ